MFIHNTTKKNIVERSFEGGYVITVPPGVCAIFDKAGEFLVNKYAPAGENGVWKGVQFIPQNPTEAPVVKATEEEWKKGKSRYAKVGRFQIPRLLIQKAGLLKIAAERGLTGLDAKADDEIMDALNNQPVPEKIQYPD